MGEGEGGGGGKVTQERETDRHVHTEKGRMGEAELGLFPPKLHLQGSQIPWKSVTLAKLDPLGL